MPDILQIILLLLTGAVGGFMSGLLGVGGGIIFVPVIDYYLQKQGVNGHLLVSLILANSLATIVFTGAVGSIKQFKLGNYFPKEITFTAIGGIITSLSVSYLISTTTFYSKDMFNIIFALMLLVLIVRMLKNQKEAVAESILPSHWTPIHYSLVGAVTGCATALSGLGGGLVMVPVFNQLLRLNLKTSTSISTGVITFLVLPITVYYAMQQLPYGVVLPLQLGWLNGQIILPLAIGSIFFTQLGVKASHTMKPAKIKIIFMIFALLVLSKTVWEIL